MSRRSLDLSLGSKCITMLLLAATFWSAGCVKELGTESRPLGRVERDCVVPRPAGIEAWGAPVSIEYADRSLWIWESVTLTGGESRRNVAALVDSVDGACNGALSFATDTAGLLAPLVLLDGAETQENATRTDGRRFELAVTGGFVHQNRGYVYYEKRLVGPGIFDLEVLGMGLCLIEQPGGPCERTRPALHPDEPTLLFRGRRTLNRGAFVDDGYANLVACFHANAFEDLCSLARVRPDDAADPSKYEFRGFDSWTTDWWNSATILNSAGSVTPAYIPFLKRYVMISTNIWEFRIEIRAGDSLWDSATFEGTLFEALPPAQLWFIAGGVEHAALRTEGGRTIAVSYYTDGASAKGLHLVTLRFAQPL